MSTKPLSSGQEAPDEVLFTLSRMEPGRCLKRVTAPRGRLLLRRLGLGWIARLPGRLGDGRRFSGWLGSIDSLGCGGCGRSRIERIDRGDTRRLLCETDGVGDVGLRI